MSYHILSMLCVCVFFLNFDYRNATHATFIHTKYFCFPSRFLFSYSERNVEKESPKKQTKQRYSSCDGTTMIFRDGENICLPFPFLPPGFLVLLFLQTNVQGWKAVHTLKIKMFRENRKSKIPDKLKCPRMRRNFVSGFKFVPFKDRHCLRMVTWWSETLEWRHRMYAPPTPLQIVFCFAFFFFVGRRQTLREPVVWHSGHTKASSFFGH